MMAKKKDLLPSTVHPKEVGEQKHLDGGEYDQPEGPDPIVPLGQEAPRIERHVEQADSDSRNSMR